MKKKKSQRGAFGSSPHNPGFPSRDELLDALAAQSRPMRVDGILRIMGLARRAKGDLEAMLTGLADQGRLLRLRGGLWARPEALKHIVGRFSSLRDGGGFVTPMRPVNDGENSRDSRLEFTGARDVYIPAAQTGEAWHQDIVRVALSPGAARGPSPEGRIIEVVERGLAEIPAHAAHRTGNTLFCRPADARLNVNFSVELAAGDTPPQPGTLVLLAPQQRLASDLWSARIVGDYGREDDVAVQEELVKLNHEVPRDFPAGVLAEAQQLPEGPTAQDTHDREDVRHLPLVTIDGADARDFDDAVQVEDLPGGGWLLRVAIADVSHYVRPRGSGSTGALDAEALARGNSWYFPKSVEPMLPEVLSNGLCSLRPDVDRLAMLAEIPFTAQGKPGKPRFAQIVMRSAARLTYDQVKACMLDNDAAALATLRENPRGEEVYGMLQKAFALYAALRDARRQRGSLDFDLPEADSRLDEAGRVVWMGHRMRHDAHRLIEEFMIAANEAVARYLRDVGMPFLYRVHPLPDPERLESLFDTLAGVGMEDLPPRPDAAAMQGILARVQGTDMEFLVNRLCLRAMPQARYQPFNEGHFGLASQAYCHFTSPIRRYADLLTHRALKTALGIGVGALPAGQKLLRIGDQINRRERAAMACEREMDRRMGCLALLPRVGEHFKGMVAGVTDFGIFVELADMPVEGMIRIDDLGDDWYDFDPHTMSLVGQRSGVMWRMGQSLEVALADVNLGRLEIRLMPLELPKAAQGNWRGRGKASRAPSRKPAHKGGAKQGRAGSAGGSRSGWKITSPGDESGKGGGKGAGKGKSSRRGGGTGYGGKAGGTSSGSKGSGGRTGKKRGR
ncbi:ribonuclease R family protein [Desulfovibrio sp.]|uniref:ribonuclease R family protein n=1 Tax=Desulfovibrio sp. TaxID=885 RepID=UPI0035B4F63D